MRSVIIGAILLLCAFIFVAKAAVTEELVGPGKVRILSGAEK